MNFFSSFFTLPCSLHIMLFVLRLSPSTSLNEKNNDGIWMMGFFKIKYVSGIIEIVYRVVVMECGTLFPNLLYMVEQRVTSSTKIGVHVCSFNNKVKGMD